VRLLPLLLVFALLAASIGYALAAGTPVPARVVVHGATLPLVAP
jgi:hypothetical protein